MHILVRIAFVIGGNAFALWVANRYIPGFVVHATVFQLLAMAILLALLNAVVKPLLTLILGPVIVLTLGLGVLIVNALMVYLLPIIANHLDMLKGSISIETIPALIMGTIVISAVNFVIHLAA